jgi:hypothetical protein
MEYIEEKILDGVRALFEGRVNAIVGEVAGHTPGIRFRGGLAGTDALARVGLSRVGLSRCERAEKERVICMDAWAVKVVIDVPPVVTTPLPASPARGEEEEREEEEGDAGERACYAYSWALDVALQDDATLGGCVEFVRVTERRYEPPVAAGVGDGWRLVVLLRAITEGWL